MSRKGKRDIKRVKELGIRNRVGYGGVKRSREGLRERKRKKDRRIERGIEGYRGVQKSIKEYSSTEG